MFVCFQAVYGCFTVNQYVCSQLNCSAKAAALFLISLDLNCCFVWTCCVLLLCLISFFFRENDQNLDFCFVLFLFVFFQGKNVTFACMRSFLKQLLVYVIWLCHSWIPQFNSVLLTAFLIDFDRNSVCWLISIQDRKHIVSKIKKMHFRNLVKK